MEEGVPHIDQTTNAIFDSRNTRREQTHPFSDGATDFALLTEKRIERDGIV